MNLTDALLPGDWLAFANFVWLALVLQAARAAPWRAFLANSPVQHVFLGATVVLVLAWSFEVGVRPALGFHFLGATVYTLMFGWSLGVIGVSLAAVAVASWSGNWASLALNALLLGVLPVSTSYAIYLLVHRYLPHHLFVYIFLCAFFNAMLAAGAAGFVPKHSRREVFRAAFEALRAGRRFLPEGYEPPPEGNGQSTPRGTAREEAIGRLALLTRQQARILQLICEGLLNKQIAYELSIAETTVKAHVTAIMRKLGVQSRTQAVLIARETNFASLMPEGG